MPKPQSSSSQRLKAARLAIVAPMSSLSASSMPQPRVGNRSAAPRPCSSITARRCSRPWYSGWSASGSTRNSERGSTPSGICPRNSGSRQPGSMIGSKVGLGMKVLTLPPDQQQDLLAVANRADAAVLELGVEVAGERVQGLVVVVVGVERSGVHGSPNGSGQPGPEERLGVAVQPGVAHLVGEVELGRLAQAPLASTAPGSRRRT